MGGDDKQFGLATGAPATLAQQCPLHSGSEPRCFFDGSVPPECKGPDDFSEIDLNYSPLLARMIEEAVKAAAATLSFREYQLVGKERPESSLYLHEEEGSEWTTQGQVRNVQELSLDFVGSEDNQARARKPDATQSSVSKTERSTGDQDVSRYAGVLAEPKEIIGVVEAIRHLEDSGLLKSVIIRGYTDKRGTPVYNVDLSKARAQWVKKTLQTDFKLCNAISVELLGCGKYFSQGKNPDEQTQRVAVLEPVLDAPPLMRTSLVEKYSEQAEKEKLWVVSHHEEFKRWRVKDRKYDFRSSLKRVGDNRPEPPPETIYEEGQFDKSLQLRVGYGNLASSPAEAKDVKRFAGEILDLFEKVFRKVDEAWYAGNRGTLESIRARTQSWEANFLEAFKDPVFRNGAEYDRYLSTRFQEKTTSALRIDISFSGDKLEPLKEMLRKGVLFKSAPLKLCFKTDQPKF